MNLLTNILYWVSTGMLIPVIFLLFLGFGWSLVLLGYMYGAFAGRLKSRPCLKSLMEEIKKNPGHFKKFEQLLKGKSHLLEPLLAMQAVDWNAIHGEKILSDFELKLQKNLDGPTILMRVGPMLGLMGTLIPMGPALVGLAAGDLAAMALNMRIAFSTTVVGIFIGAIGFVVQLIRKRWFKEDGETLQYIFDLACEEKKS
ncbi:MAG: MotA/TolQ/ExbB proton channel family protein [Desulfosarcina sp.]|nr:MotA/TolQ/ExbB proton channel family protein [Desulfobacterales bacterium]